MASKLNVLQYFLIKAKISSPLIYKGLNVDKQITFGIKIFLFFSSSNISCDLKLIFLL